MTYVTGHVCGHVHVLQIQDMLRWSDKIFLISGAKKGVKWLAGKGISPCEARDLQQLNKQVDKPVKS